jgi:2,3-bisphosphoglycerate-independent phosphoglycerate mutase
MNFLEKKKVLLCILDGVALGDQNYKYNAVLQANIPNLRRFMNTYPYSFLQTSGISVGLPEGQMGNSEVGHMTIGSGRLLMQDLPRVSNAILTGEIWQNKEVKLMLEFLKKSRGKLHILGLCSNGGVHSYLPHIHSVANFFANEKIEVIIHAISDGRDVAPNDFLVNLESFEKGFEESVKIGTLCGRYYTMDRDKKYERTNAGVELILKGKGKQYNSLKEAVENSYTESKMDEFILPCKFAGFSHPTENDILFFANFRADRGRQATEKILEKKIFSKILTMMPYSQEISKHCPSLFKKEEINNTLTEVISANGLLQFKIAETEKYAHITFFFNGGKEGEVKGETRVIIPSPIIKTYDMKPEMSLPLLQEKLLDAILEDKYEFIACNIANGDMVGHTGNFEAGKIAMERIDKFLGKIEQICLEKNYYLLITADHGNLEEMMDPNGQIHTQHTTGEVPFFLISKEKGRKVKNGTLAGIAPTVLSLLGLPLPVEMITQTLI